MLHLSTDILHFTSSVWLCKICEIWRYYIWNSFGDLENSGMGLFHNCSKNSNVRNHKSHQMTQLIWNDMHKVNEMQKLSSSIKNTTSYWTLPQWLYIQFYQPNWLLNTLWNHVYFMLTVIFKNDMFIGFLQIRWRSMFYWTQRQGCFLLRGWFR